MEPLGEGALKEKVCHWGGRLALACLPHILVPLLWAADTMWQVGFTLLLLCLPHHDNCICPGTVDKIYLFFLQLLLLGWFITSTPGKTNRVCLLLDCSGPMPGPPFLPSTITTPCLQTKSSMRRKTLKEGVTFSHLILSSSSQSESSWRHRRYGSALPQVLSCGSAPRLL